MKIALLVVACRAPVSLEALAGFLVGPEFAFFVHVDAKADIQLFAEVARHPHVHLIGDRRKVFWGGFSMIEAEIALLGAAVEGGEFDRFALISDDTFAIKAPDEIKRRLEAEDLWIGSFIAPDSDWRYDKFFFFDSDATNPQHRDVRLRAFADDEISAVKSLERLRSVGKARIQVFHGPQWWCLTREAAAYVLECHRNSAHVRESFRFSAVPDESYIQTLIGLEGDRWHRRKCPMHFDFSRQPKPFVFRELAELKSLVASDALFVRKIPEDRLLLQELQDILSQN